MAWTVRSLDFSNVVGTGDWSADILVRLGLAWSHYSHYSHSLCSGLGKI